MRDKDESSDGSIDSWSLVPRRVGQLTIQWSVISDTKSDWKILSYTRGNDQSPTVTYVLYTELANCEDFNFADVQRFVDQRKLDNDVSEAKSSFIDVSTLDTDCGSVSYSARILTTQRVVP